MTSEQHFNLYKEHNQKAMMALDLYIKWHSAERWYEYKEESKLANRHLGISKAMLTTEIKKIDSLWL